MRYLWQREHLIKRCLVLDQVVSDQSPARLINRSGKELENETDAAVTVKREAVLIRNSAEKPVQQELGP